MKIKNYIWDFDGTLFNTYPVILEALTQTIRKHHIKYEGNLSYFIKKYSIREFSEQFATEDFLSDYHSLEKELQTQVSYYPEIPEILKQLIKDGGQHFVVSHRDSSTKDYLGELYPLFTEIITSDDRFARKPNPESLLYLIEKYQLNPKETVMIGDRPLDIIAGQHAGIKTILFDEAEIFVPNELNEDYRVTTWENFNNEY